jgi:hypothetical protein
MLGCVHSGSRQGVLFLMKHLMGLLVTVPYEHCYGAQSGDKGLMQEKQYLW